MRELSSIDESLYIVIGLSSTNFKAAPTERRSTLREN